MKLQTSITDKVLGLKQIALKAYLRRRGVTIGEHVEIGRYVFIDTLYPNLITIGNRIVLARGTQILSHDSSRIGPSCHPVTINDGSFIGVNTIIMPGVTIGKRCIIGAGSVVTHDVSDYCIAAGNPARVLRKVEDV